MILIHVKKITKKKSTTFIFNSTTISEKVGPKTGEGGDGFSLWSQSLAHESLSPLTWVLNEGP